MGFRYRKSFKLGSGVKLNVNKKSVGVTIGGKGAHVTLNSKGRRTSTIGIPGSGLSYTTSSQVGSKKQHRSQQNYQDTTYQDIPLPTYKEYNGKKGFSWAIFFFGPLPALLKGQFMLFFSMLFFDAGLGLAFGIYAYLAINLLFACLYNRMVFGRYVQKLMR